MRLDSAHGRLYDAVQTLVAKRDEAYEKWDDAARADYDRQFAEELIFRAKETLAAIDRLQQLFRTIRTECEGNPDQHL